MHLCIYIYTLYIYTHTHIHGILARKFFLFEIFKKYPHILCPLTTYITTYIVLAPIERRLFLSSSLAYFLSRSLSLSLTFSLTHFLPVFSLSLNFSFSLSLSHSLSNLFSVSIIMRIFVYLRMRTRGISLFEKKGKRNMRVAPSANNIVLRGSKKWRENLIFAFFLPTLSLVCSLTRSLSLSLSLLPTLTHAHLLSLSLFVFLSFCPFLLLNFCAHTAHTQR